MAIFLIAKGASWLPIMMKLGGYVFCGSDATGKSVSSPGWKMPLNINCVKGTSDEMISVGQPSKPRSFDAHT